MERVPNTVCPHHEELVKAVVRLSTEFHDFKDTVGEKFSLVNANIKELGDDLGHLFMNGTIHKLTSRLDSIDETLQAQERAKENAPEQMAPWKILVIGVALGASIAYGPDVWSAIVAKFVSVVG